MWRLVWFFKRRAIDRKIAEGKFISEDEAYLILKKAISIHDYLIEATWDDPAISGDDELHKEWIFWYEQIIAIVYGYAALITVDEAIDRLKYDVYTHQYWIDYKLEHPEFQLGYRGDINWQKKWKARWLAIIKLLEKRR
jgi:hypothetical protein